MNANIREINNNNNNTKYKMFAGQMIVKLEFANWTSKFASIAELEIANEQIFIEIVELKNAK